MCVYTNVRLGGFEKTKNDGQLVPLVMAEVTSVKDLTVSSSPRCTTVPYQFLETFISQVFAFTSH